MVETPRELQQKDTGTNIQGATQMYVTETSNKTWVVLDTIESVCMITAPHACTELPANSTRARLLLRSVTGTPECSK